VPYIGKQLVRGQNRKLDDISSGFNGSQTTFTLQVASQNVTVGSALQLWISLGGVIQDPLSDYTIAGNQITFTTAPAASLDFFGVIQGDVTDTNTPGDATVTTSKLSTGLTVNLADGSAATSSLQLGGTDSGLFSSAADKVNVTTGGVERLEIGDSEVVFNDPSNDVDFRVESNGNANMLFVDAGNDRVGIGTSSPSAPLHLNAGTTNDALFIDSSDAVVSIGLAASDGAARLLQISGGLAFRTNGNANTFGTGDSERMRIDSSGRVGIGTSSPSNVLHVEKNNSSADLVYLNNTGVSASDVLRLNTAGTGSGTNIFDAQSGGTSRFLIRGDGNVGIGTTSPDELLHVANTGGGASILIETNASSGGNLLFGDNSSNTVGRVQYNHSDNSMRLHANGSERLRIDSSGRLLIGISSSRNVGFAHTVQIEGTDGITSSMSLIRNSNDNNGPHIDFAKSRGTSTGSNTVVQSGDTLGNLVFRGVDGSDANTVACQIQGQVDGTPGSNDMPGRLVFKTTADGASSATERMRIDSSGRVLVGTTSAFGATASELLQVANSNGGKISLLRNDTSIGTGNEIGVITWYSADGTTQAAASIACHADGDHATDDKPGRLVFSTTEDGASSPDEKMRIFNTGQTHHFSTVNGLFVGSSLGAGATNWLFRGNRNRTNNSQGGVTVFYVFTNGNVQNTNNSYGAISDVKLKENIVDATSQWDDLKALRVRKYNLIEGETHTQLGVVAQEVETVSPGLVNDITDRDEEGNDLGTVTKTVNYSVLYMKAVKALQEAMDRIETLETKVAALEAE